MFKKYLMTVVVFASVLLGNAAHAVLLTLEPATQQAAPGDTVSIELHVSGLGEGTPPLFVGGFDMDIMFDPAVLSFLGPYTLGAGLGDPLLGEALDLGLGDLGAGVINIAELSLLENDSSSCLFCSSPYLQDLQGVSILLATLDFRVDVLPLGSMTLVDIGIIYGLSDGIGAPLDYTVRNAQIENVESVPAPPTLALIALGLLGTGFTRYRAR
ncbi:MAG: cohesin domain-containing protein [Halioglobus sp.]